MNQPTTAIALSGVHKSFRMPTHRVQTLKERALHPLRSIEYTELHAVEDVSLEIAAGEFFGIAGRNGSGKTTLLKLMASIYRPDRGRIRIAGRMAPFIELGVGFNPDLAALDNVLLNGVMMGLSPKEAAQRFEQVIEFAELEQFTELKLKNYSSGMRVRLGFAMLVEAEADVLLIDEVLAVGDASFQQKCTDTFYKLREEGKTIILVTHAMEKLMEYCDRAVLLHEGRVDRIGDPGMISQRYLELNFGPDGESAVPAESSVEVAETALPAIASQPATIAEFRFEDESGRPTDRFAHGDPIHFRAIVEASEDLDGAASFDVVVRNSDWMFLAHIRSGDLLSSDGPLIPGERLNVSGNIENPFGSGRYVADVALLRHGDPPDRIDLRMNAAEFMVFGAGAPAGASGITSLPHEFRFERERGRELTPSGAPNRLG